MKENYFSDIGGLLKRIASILFVFTFLIGMTGIVIGILVFLVGLSEADSFLEGLACTLVDVMTNEDLAQCYWGKTIISWSIVCLISSLSAIVLEAFGELVQSTQKIRESLSDINIQKEITKTAKEDISRNNNTKVQNEHNWRCNECGKWITTLPCPFCGSEK